MYRGITEQGLVALHDVVRQQFPHGITGGKIDGGKIKAIAEKPHMQLYGRVKYDTIYRKAACYLEGITRLHPFPDGNKRTAILVAFSFLQKNGRYLALPLDTVRFLVNVAREEGGTEDEVDALIDRIAVWLEERTATDRESYIEKMEEYVITPVHDLENLEPAHAKRILDDWLAVDFHPEYEVEITDIAQFLARTLTDSAKAINNMRSRDGS